MVEKTGKGSSFLLRATERKLINASKERVPLCGIRHLVEMEGVLMPRGRTNAAISSLSLNIPRHIHRRARVNMLRTGSPTLAAFVAWWLSQIPSEITADEAVEINIIELELKLFAKTFDNNEVEHDRTANHLPL